jgi:YbgC/YbaW family acyl-CoA thioester hydrolase
MLGMDVGGELVMRASNIEYHAPARFDDLLEVFIRVARIGRTSATYEMAAYRVEDDALMVTAGQTLVLVDLEERKACPIPDEVRVRIQEFEGDDAEV